MHILTFDTSLDKTYITLSNKSNIISSYTITSNDEKYHSAYLISKIANILKENNLTMQSVKMLSTNIGPGSFTGIRVCLSVAKVIAQQLNIKALGISSLQILAQANTTEKPTLVLMDARKNKSYLAIYQNNKEIIAPCAVELENIKNFIKQDCFIITDNKMAEFLEENNITYNLNYQKQSLELGKYLAQIAIQTQDKSIEDLSWNKLKALYIQPAPVTLKKELRQN